MASLKHNCPKCGKPARIQSEFPFPVGKLINYVYACGHMELRTKLDEISEDAPQDEIKISQEDLDLINSSVYDWESPAYAKGPHEFRPYIREVFWSLETVPEYFCEECQEFHTRKHLYKFQREGVQFIEKTQVRALLADEMGLGKTPTAAVVLKENKQILLPALVIVKGTTLLQWYRELKSWSFGSFADVAILQNRNQFIPGHKVYVISMDFLSRKGVLELLNTLNLKCVIVDECQSFKDASSKRTVALIKLLQENNIDYLLEMSGTPIKNRASEYFVSLNLLAPAHFTSYAHFCRQWLLPNEKGVYSRLNPVMATRFNEITSRWILRRESKDVQKDLPELRISYRMIEIEDEDVKKSYNHQLDLFNNFLKNTARINSNDLLGWLAKLRSITGQAKVPAAVEYTRDFIESMNGDKSKIAIGIHHKSVRDTLKFVFENDNFKTLTLSGEDDNFDKDKIAREFNENVDQQILIINMIAGGVGLNLQGCHNFLALERTWNGADEDQFHKRFHRHGQKSKVSGTYLIAAGTIDEWFHNLVWEKRNNLASMNIGEEVDETQSSGFLREFSEFVVRHKL